MSRPSGWSGRIKARFKWLLEPVGAPAPRFAARAIVILLAASAGCVLVAPMAMPDGYSWLSNAISESAAQGLHAAWVARLGFVLFGCAVVWLAVILRPVWARGTYWMQLAFGVFMLGTAAFSHKPWLPKKKNPGTGQHFQSTVSFRQFISTSRNTRARFIN